MRCLYFEYNNTWFMQLKWKQGKLRCKITKCILSHPLLLFIVTIILRIIMPMKRRNWLFGGVAVGKICISHFISSFSNLEIDNSGTSTLSNYMLHKRFMNLINMTKNVFCSEAYRCWNKKSSQCKKYLIPMNVGIIEL